MTACPAILRVPVLVGPPGSGKTTEMRRRIMATTGVHVLALPITELIDEQVAFLRTEAQSQGIDLKVFKVHSDTNGRKKVQTQFDEAVQEIIDRRIVHAVIVMTHYMLMHGDLSALSGTHYWIDEVPNAVVTGSVTLTDHTRELYKGAFDFTKGDDAWSILVPKGRAPTRRELAADSFLRVNSSLHEQVHLRDGLLVNITDWTASSFQWFGVWTPRRPTNPASITVGGAGFTDSIPAKVIEKWLGDQIEFVEEPLDYKRTGQPRITINWFTQHDFTSLLWKTSEGRRLVKKIADYLGAWRRDLGYWSGNEVATWLLEHRVRGKLTPPKLAGLNEHRQRKSCAFFYSAKATLDDSILLDHLGISREEIERAREEEDVFQFVCRGIIRQPDYDGPYAIYLYSRAQAERLADHLGRAGFTKVVLMPAQGAGLVNDAPVAAKLGRKPEQPDMTPEERTARKTQQKAVQRRRNAEKDAR